MSRSSLTHLRLIFSTHAYKCFEDERRSRVNREEIKSGGKEREGGSNTPHTLRPIMHVYTRGLMLIGSKLECGGICSEKMKEKKERRGNK